MKRRFTLSLCTAVLEIAVLANSLWAQAVQPVISVTIPSLNSASAEMTDMASAAQDPKAAFAAACFQAFINQDDFKAAIDTQRPFGLLLLPKENAKPEPIVIFPVNDMEKLLSLKFIPVNVKIEKLDDANWKILAGKNENPKTLFLTSFNGWCLVRENPMSEEIAAALPELVKTLTNDAVRGLGIALYVNAIPQADREKVFTKAIEKAFCCLDKKAKCMGEPMKDLFKKELEKLAESAERHAYESPVSKAQLNYFWDIEADKLVVTNTFTGDAEKRQIKNLSRVTKGGETLLANFGKTDSLASYQFNASIEEMNDPIVREIQSMRIEQIRKVLTERKGEAAANEIAGFFEENADLFRTAFMGQEIEKAGAIYAGESTLTLTGARIVPDGYAIEKEFQKAVKYIGQKKGEKVKAHVKDAVRTEENGLHIYQANFIPKKPLPKELNALFNGQIPACVIFAQNGIYCAIGTNAKETLLNSIANEVKAAEAPLLSGRLSIQNFAEVAKICKKLSNEQYEKIEKVGEAEISSEVLSLENGVQFRTEVPASVLRILVLAAPK